MNDISVLLNILVPVALCLCIGIVTQQYFVTRYQVLKYGVAFGAVAAVSVVVFTEHLLQHSGVPMPLAAVAGFVSMFGPFCYRLMTGHKHAQFMRENAPSIATFGLDKFAALDADQDGELSGDDLDRFLQGPLSREVRKSALLLREHLAEVGHMSEQYVEAFSPEMGFMSTPPVAFSYRITKDDLATLVERTTKRYLGW